MSAFNTALGLIASAFRADGWENFLTGMGTARDKTEHSHFSANAPLTNIDCAQLYHHSDIAARIADIIPGEMLREGFCVKSTDTRALEIVTKKLVSLGAYEHIKEASTWSRVYGGALILVGADDGQDAGVQINKDRIKSLNYLAVYEPRHARPYAWFDDGSDPRFGTPSVYQITNPLNSLTSYVHASRVIRFNGVLTGKYERKVNLGWDYSIFQRMYRPIRQFDSVFKAAEIMMSDANQGVFKMSGLMAAIAEKKTEDILTRAQLLDMTRSISRSIMLDADGQEDFTKVPTSFGGIAEMLDRCANRLSAASGIPVTVLIGQSPAGLSATGASDIRLFYDHIAADRDQKLKPRVVELVDFVASAEKVPDKDYDVGFKSLWQESPKELADRNFTEAQTAAAWITAEVLTADQVAIARFGSDEPQPYRVDPKTRATLQTPPSKEPDADEN